MLLKIIMSFVAIGFSMQALAADHSIDDVSSTTADTIKCSADANAEFGIDPDYIEKQIAATNSCYEASKIAESCAAGSSMDNGIAGAAAEVCDKKTGKLNKSDKDLKKKMQTKCSQICDPREEGTLCISEVAFCFLEVSKFMNSVNTRD